jgi:hypothetical protein
MTEPSKATTADQGPEVVEDLDVTGDDADDIAGGGVVRGPVGPTLVPPS